MLTSLFSLFYVTGGWWITHPPPPPPHLDGLYRYMRRQRVWFSAVLVINRASILAEFGHLVINRVWFLYSSLDMAMVLKPRSHIFIIYQKENQQKPFTNYVYGNFTSA